MNLLVTGAFLAFGPAPPTTYADVLSAVHGDLARTAPALRPSIRYLSLQGIPAKERGEALRILNGHCNSLSGETDAVSVVLVDGVAARVNLLDYGWTRETWERLQDPYWTVGDLTVTYEEVPWPGGVWPDDGKVYPKGSFKYSRPKEKLTAIAPWVTAAGKDKLSEVVAWTSSRSPVVRADWFLGQTAKQDGSRVGYYDFLGIKDQASFEKLVRFSAPLASKLEHRRVVAFSGITLQPRRVERTATVLGGLWRTFDSAEATDKRNPLRILDNDFQFDATEQFAPLPNGLPAWLLADSKGKLQSKAPDNIVGRDPHGWGNDGRLHVGISCWRCHVGQAKHESVIKDIEFLRIRDLRSYDYDKLQELRRQYLRNVGPALEMDRKNYALAIREITGWEPQNYADKLALFYSRYEDAKVDLARAAAEMGMATEDLRAALHRYDDATRYLDPMLSVILDGGRIPIRQWEEVFPVAMGIVYGTTKEHPK